ncbi:MAG: PAS domain S-box protein [Candidatus Riflebacteria bacterium]|nr:PAS domain S-box protein [Candidatus Riflebacteria bacterium]
MHRADLAWSCDAQGRFTHLAAAWQQVLGGRPEGWVGRSLPGFQPPPSPGPGGQSAPGPAPREAAWWFETALSVEVDGSDGYDVGHPSLPPEMPSRPARSAPGQRVVFLMVWAVPRFDDLGTFLGADGTAIDLTARHREAETLRESEAKYRSLVEMTADWLWEIDADGRHTFSNGKILALLGYPREEVIGQPVGFLLHPDDAATAEARFRHHLEARQGWRGWVMRWRHKEGGYRFLESNADPIWDAAGKIRGFRGSDRDVTERWKAEKMLRIQQDLASGLYSCHDLRQGAELVLAAGLQMETIDSGGVYLADPADGSLELIVHRGLSEGFISTVTRFPGQSPRASLVRDGQPRYGAYREMPGLAGPAGITEGIRALAVIPIMSEGRLIAVLNLASHTHDTIPLEVRRSLESIALQIGATLVRLRTDAALRESEEIFRLFMEHSPIYVFFKDDRIRAIRLSRNFAGLVGRPVAEQLGRTMEELFPSEFARKMVADDQRVLAGGKAVTLEEEFNGRVYSTIKFPIIIDGKPRYLAGFTIDITGQRKMLDSLRRVDKLDSLGVLAGGIAHDFNNLLGGILGNIEMARRYSPAGSPGERHLDRALGVFDRARDLTRQLLTFSKGGAPRRQTGNLAATIQENVAFVLAGSNVRCEFRLSPGLWSCDFDAGQIGQVIDNIVINAQQAMPNGGQIVIEAANVMLEAGDLPPLKAGRYVQVSVTDAGIGIPQDLLGRVFDPFFSTKQKGSGLGLAICYSIMQKHDGLISVESTPGKGTTFHLHFPASSGEVAGKPPALSVGHRGRGRILVMDDEDFLRDLMVRMIGGMGYQVVTAADGAEALRLFAEARAQGEPFRAAFFDLTVPGGMGGREAVAQLREGEGALPVFAVSGYSEDPAMAAPRSFRFTDSIRKPFRMDDLADLLNRHLKEEPGS